jgi:phospholipase/carboxylesterase
MLSTGGELTMSEAMAIARLLDTLDALGFIARHLHPPRLKGLVATLGDRDAALREALADAIWPDELRDHVERAAEATLRACDGLRAAVGSTSELRQALRALRQVSRALEALYPLASVMPTVSRWFLAADNAAIGAARTDVPTGVLHAENETSERGGFSLYVPCITTLHAPIRW